MAVDVSTPKYRKSEWIAQDVREQIVRGRYGADGRLPTRVEMCNHYGVSLGTVQKALQRLQDEGFIKTDGTRGTTVAADSPHLSTYAFLFPFSQDWVRSSQLMSALVHEAGVSADNRQFVMHYGVEGSTTMERLQQLIEDVEQLRVAGLIFAVAPFFLKDTPVVKQGGIPRVSIMSGGLGLPIPGVGFDRASLFQRVTAAMAAAGRRRPAMITPPFHHAVVRDDWQAHCRAAGLAVDDRWLQQCPLGATEWLPSLLDLLLSLPADQRPDALYVNDDNLLPRAGEALAARGVSVPDDLLLLSHCNWPWPTPCAVPVTRVGFSVPELLDTCIRGIDAQRDGAACPKLTSLTACTAAEYAGSVHAPCRVGERLQL